MVTTRQNSFSLVELSDHCSMPNEQMFRYNIMRTSYILMRRWWYPLCTRPTPLRYSASSLKQQSVGRHVSPLIHIILIPSQPIFALTPYCCLYSGKAANTNFIVCGLTRLWMEPTIYGTPGWPLHHWCSSLIG